VLSLTQTVSLEWGKLTSKLNLLSGLCDLNSSGPSTLYTKCFYKDPYGVIVKTLLLISMVELCFDFTVGQMRSIFD
jgi:hypothetical protein